MSVVRLPTYTAFSYSRLNNFETCPKKFYALSIAKTHQEVASEAMTYGSDVHKALEMRVARGRPLPLHLSHLEPAILPLASAPGTRRTEFQMAVNYDLAPVGWFAKDVYCRAIADYTVNRKRKGLVVDYKTGKKADDFMQLKLTGALFFQHEPEVDELTLAFFWTKDRTMTKIKMQRAEMPVVWATLMPQIERYQKAFREMNFPPRAGRHCRWCPVNSCPYWGDK